MEKKEIKKKKGEKIQKKSKINEKSMKCLNRLKFSILRNLYEHFLHFNI